MAKTASKTVKRTSAPVRLWVKARFLSFRRFYSWISKYYIQWDLYLNHIRSRDRLECQQSLIKLQDVNDRKGLRYYHGKRVAYVYKAHKTVANTKYRVKFTISISQYYRLSGEKSWELMVITDLPYVDSERIYQPEPSVTQLEYSYTHKEDKLLTPKPKP